MSQLQRLNIVGIRSFGPEEQDLQKIKFFSPLTLIQGQNGCGKTTIIEALKFAITGELPGGTNRGQGFVHDPKLSKVYESRGQIKLRVSDTKGELVTVTKTVMVTQKAKDKLEYKRLDSTIGRGKPGEGEHISGKCVDIDSEMCLALGVSKPILNNVIFCHQEESNWPLDESSKLKVKFDEIFDVTKYNKCTKAMEASRKKGDTDLRILKEQKNMLKEIKQQVETKRDQLTEKQNKLETLIEDITLNKAKHSTVTTRLDEIFKTEKDFNALCAEVEIKKKHIEGLVKQQTDLLKNAKEFIGTDEELNSKINKFEENLKNLDSDINILLKKKKDIEETEKKLRQNINEKQMKLGSLQAEEKQNNMKKDSRNKLITKSVKDFELSNKYLQNFDENIQEILSELKDKLENKKVSVDVLESSIKQDENMIQDDIDKIREENAKIKHNIQIKNTNISESKDELKKIQNEINLLNSAGEHLRISDNRLKRLEKDLTGLESSVNVVEIREKIESEKKNHKTLEDRLTEVDSEVQTLQQYTSLQTELDLKNGNLISKQTEYQKLKNKHEKNLNKIFDNNVPNSDLKRNVEKFQISQNKLTRDMTQKINEKQRTVMQCESNKNNLREKLEEKKQELLENQNELSEHCADKNLEDVIDETQEKIKRLQKDKGLYFSSIYLYEKFITQIKNDSCCPVCKRGVEERQVANQIVNDLSKKIESFPNLQQQTEQQLILEQKKYDTLLTLRPLSEKLEKLQQEVPKLESEFENFESKFKSSSAELETLKNDIKNPQENEKVVNSLIGDVALIDQLQKEIEKIKQEISYLNLQMPKESNRGLHEAQNEQESLKSDIKKSRNDVESLQNKLSRHLERLQQLKEEKNKLISEQLQIKQSLQGKDNLITRSIELETKLTELKNEVETLEVEIKNSTKTLQESLKYKEQQQAKNKSKMDEARKFFNFLQNILNNINQYQKEIDEFTKKDITNQVQSINDAIQEIKQKIDDYSSKKSKIDSNVDELKSQISNSKINYRELQDNVQLRKNKSEQLSLEKELTTLEQNLGNNDISALKRERNRLMEREKSLQELILRSEGQKTQITIQIKEIENELSLPRNAQVNLNYKKKYLEVATKERVLRDLKFFIKSIDWSLMQFHKQKMIQINSIIKDLWRLIYKGNDIDYIEIQTSDCITGTDKRKTFNYGIMQVKNEAELDMRGRCSAGQKVLASLIIRIALSETFSTNCGILTLDEPTTNLDRENINSLCDALVELVSQKRLQKNFQLVIITHDQEFVDRLTRSESLEQYYVIKRNEVGKSVISVKR